MNNIKQLVIITGHSAGLGRALAQHYLAAGWPVLGVSRRLWALTPGLNQVALDLADGAALAAWLQSDAWRQALAGAGEVLLFNNAGTVQPNALAGRQAADDIVQAVALNVAAPLLLSNALIADAPAGCLKTIVHISSGAGRNAYAGWSVYGATKAALDQHARVLAAEQHPHLRVGSIAPGVVDTDMQTAIRSSDAAVFPLRGRFDDLHRDGALRSPEYTAAQIAAMIATADFGQTVCRDVRAPQ